MRVATFLNGLMPLTSDDGIKTNNDEINSLLDQLKEIVDGTIMPIIYVVLGLFLVVKGGILGMQIVKAADEPQVRQEKIGSLKWLVIGVAIAFAVAGIAHVAINYFAGLKSDLSGTSSSGGSALFF